MLTHRGLGEGDDHRIPIGYERQRQRRAGCRHGKQFERHGRLELHHVDVAVGGERRLRKRRTDRPDTEETSEGERQASTDVLAHDCQFGDRSRIARLGYSLPVGG